MKIKYTLLAVIALVAVFAVAQTASAHVDPLDPTHVDEEVAPSDMPTVVPPGQKLVPPKPPANRAATIKANIDSRIEVNKDARNNLLEKRVELRKDLASTTKDMRMDARVEIKDMRMDARADFKAERASSTAMFKQNKDMRKEIAKKMEAKVFETRKNALVKELNLSLTNIASISTRIDARIVKVEAEGRTMTEAKALLVTANEKLVKAKAEVAAFQALTVNPTSFSTAATTTIEVELTKPRQAGDAAIKSVKEARDAFQKVVVAIGKGMGVKSETSVSGSVETN